MRQRLVIAVFVQRAELQMRVEMKLKAPAVLGNHNALIGRGARNHHLALEDMLFAPLRHVVRFDQDGPQEKEQKQSADAQPQGVARQQRPKEPGAPQADQRVEHADQDGRAHQPQVRHEDQREQHRGEESANIIERQYLRHQVLEVELFFHDAHQQRQFQPDQRADHDDVAVQQRQEGRGPAVTEIHGRDRHPAQQRDAQFHLDKRAPGRGE